MTTTMKFVPTPQAQKAHADLVRMKLIPIDATITGALTLEDALKITDETERNKLAQIAVDRQHDKVKKAVTPPALRIPAYKPYKHNQKIILGSDTEDNHPGQSWQGDANSTWKGETKHDYDIRRYAAACGITEEQAHDRIDTQRTSDNGHITYGPMPAAVIEPQPAPVRRIRRYDRGDLMDVQQAAIEYATAAGETLYVLCTLKGFTIQREPAINRSYYTVHPDGTTSFYDRNADIPPAPDWEAIAAAEAQPIPEPIPITRTTRPRVTPQPTPTTAESFARSVARSVTQKGRNLWVSFESKPSSEIRDQLKQHGFRWAAKRQAWWLDTTRTSSSTINDMAVG